MGKTPKTSKTKSGTVITSANATGMRKVLISMRKHWQIYVLLIPAAVWYIMFAYYPMAGLQLAFKTYKVREGIWGSPWCGLKNYEAVFRDSYFWNSISRTLMVNLGRLIFTFPAPVLLALMLNELRMGKYKKFIQTVFTFPHFLSWVIVASILTNLLSIDGLVNSALTALGGNVINFLGNEKLFTPHLYVSDIWKGAGYSSIIYLSAISGIDQDQYEAAEIDGAGRLKKTWYVSIPQIVPIIIIMGILDIGKIFRADFGLFYNVTRNVGALYPTTDVIDTYVFRALMTQGNIGMASAVGLFQSVVCFVTLMATNLIVKKISPENALF